MMPVNNIGEMVLVCAEADFGALPVAIQSQPGLYVSGVHLIDITTHIQERRVPLIDGLPLERYLDRFYVWYSADPVDRQRMVDSIFDAIAGKYDTLVDINRNLDNIRNLIRFLECFGVLSSCLPIADFGCGTGLAHLLTDELSINLIGIERCPSMREAAINRGMNVLSPQQLAQQPHDVLAGAFASYVFHLLSYDAGLRLLWSRMAKGGVLVGNFHKGKGMELVTECLSGPGCKVSRLESPVGPYQHGAYVAYVKG